MSSQSSFSIYGGLLEMRQLLAGEGLELSGDSNQCPDHIGLELLFASHLARKVAQVPADEAASALTARFAEFAEGHPLAWLDSLIRKVDAARPDGYVARILTLARALLVAGCA